MNGRVLQNVEKYEKLLVTSPAKSVGGSGLKRPTSTYLRTRDTYERLCQTQGSQVYNTIICSQHILYIRKISGRDQGKVNMTSVFLIV